jgi:hypothetical protein
MLLQDQDRRPSAQTHNAACIQLSCRSSSIGWVCPKQQLLLLLSLLLPAEQQLWLVLLLPGPQQQGLPQLPLLQSHAAGQLPSLLQKPWYHSTKASHAQEQQ